MDIIEMKRIAVLFSFGFLLSGNMFSQSGKIKGHLLDRNTGEGFAYANVQIESLGQGCVSDTAGNFIIHPLPVDTYKIKISSIGYKDTIINNVIVQKDSITLLKINYPAFCASNVKNNRCPICNKTDKAIRIVYGFPGRKLMKRANRKEVRLGGCIISGCDPFWYCKRDKVEF